MSPTTFMASLGGPKSIERGPPWFLRLRAMLPDIAIELWAAFE
jgi:hypothetical protein